MPTTTAVKKRKRKKKEPQEEENPLINAVYHQAIKQYPKATGTPYVKFLFKTDHDGERHRFRVNWVEKGRITFSVFVIAFAKAKTVEYEWRV